MANEGVPYYPPVAPEVPVADHTAAKIIANADLAGSFTRGLAAFGQIAAASKRAQLESEQMATDAALKSRQLDIARENNLLDYKVGIANAGRISKYQQDRAAAKAEEDANLFTHVTRLQNEISDYQNQKEKFGLNDPNPKNVPTFLKNHIQLAYDFENANIPAIKEDIKNTSKRVKEMQAKIPLTYGATSDEDGKWTGGVKRIFTPAEVLSQLGNPDTRDLMANALDASGLMKSPRPLGLAVGGSMSATGEATEYQAPEWLTNWYTQSKGVDMTPTGTPRPSIAAMSQWMAKKTPQSASGLPTGVTQADVDAAGAAMSAESTPHPDNNELLNPTDEEKEIAKATRAASMPGADKDRIRSIFQSKGYDPSKLSF